MGPDMRETVDGITFQYSKIRLAGLALLGVGMTALSAWLPQWRIVPAGSFKEFIVWFGVLFFGAATLVAVSRLFKTGDILIIDRTGIRDTRMTETLLPWSAINSLSRLDMQTHKFLVLQLDPAFRATLPLSRKTRMGLAGNQAIGIDGIPFTMQGLDGSFADLEAAVQRFGPARSA